MSSRLASHSLRSETCGPSALVPTRAGEARRLSCLRSRGWGAWVNSGLAELQGGRSDARHPGGSALLRDGGRPSNGTVQGAIHYPSQSTILAGASLSSRLRSARESVYFVLCRGSCGGLLGLVGCQSRPLSSRRVVCRVPLSNAGNLVICDVISASEKYDENIASAIS